MVQKRVATIDLGGRLVPRFKNMVILDGKATIQEAIDRGYVTGVKADAAYAIVRGVLRAMLAGCMKDGNGRKFDDKLTIKPFAQGRLEDVCDSFDKKNAKVSVRARMLKDMKINTDEWYFTVEGATGTIVIRNITTGEQTDVVFTNEAVLINGKKLTLGEGDSIGWKVPAFDLSGNVTLGSCTSDDTRITIPWAAMNFGEVHQEIDGKDIEFELKIGDNKARKVAMLRYNV